MRVRVFAVSALFILISSSASADVPWLTSFQILPEVDLVWQRSYPENWEDYKPPQAPSLPKLLPPTG